MIAQYNLVCGGHEATAQLLASQLSLTTPMTSHVDLGCGNGYTAAAVLTTARLARSVLTLVLVDGLPSMLTSAADRLQIQCAGSLPSGVTIRGVFADVAGDLAAVR